MTEQREACMEDAHAALVENEELRRHISEKVRMLRAAQAAHDKLDDDMEYVEGRKTEVVLSLQTKLADATETVNATAHLRKQAHDLEADVVIIIVRLVLESEAVRIAVKELEMR